MKKCNYCNAKTNTECLLPVLKEPKTTKYPDGSIEILGERVAYIPHLICNECEKKIAKLLEKMYE